MEATVNNKMLSQGELAKRWGRSESAISLAAAVGTGPRYVKINGAIKYPFDEVQRYERACLLAETPEAEPQTLN